MERSFVVRSTLRYAVGYGGGLVLLALLLPFTPYALLGLITFGTLLFLRAMMQTDGRNRQIHPGEADSTGLALAVGSDDILDSGPRVARTSAKLLYVALGLITFGGLALGVYTWSGW